MDQENRRLVLLIAEPGGGKSTFMAQLAQDCLDDWLIYFICRDQRELLGDMRAKSSLRALVTSWQASIQTCFPKH